MAEYIQLQKKYYDGIMIKEVLDEFENDYDTLLAMLNRFASMDGADVTERKTGRWERHYSRPNVYADLWWHCSVCGYKNDDQYANIYHNYCPNCGCRMMEVEHEQA